MLGAVALPIHEERIDQDGGGVDASRHRELVIEEENVSGRAPALCEGRGRRRHRSHEPEICTRAYDVGIEHAAPSFLCLQELMARSEPDKLWEQIEVRAGPPGARALAVVVAARNDPRISLHRRAAVDIHGNDGLDEESRVRLRDPLVDRDDILIARMVEVGDETHLHVRLQEAAKLAAEANSRQSLGEGGGHASTRLPACAAAF